MYKRQTVVSRATEQQLASDDLLSAVYLFKRVVMQSASSVHSSPRCPFPQRMQRVRPVTGRPAAARHLGRKGSGKLEITNNRDILFIILTKNFTSEYNISVNLPVWRLKFSDSLVSGSMLNQTLNVHSNGCWSHCLFGNFYIHHWYPPFARPVLTVCLLHKPTADSCCRVQLVSASASCTMKQLSFCICQ